MGGEEKIIIAFGFDENKASATNAVYEYNISKNKMSLLFPGTEQGNESIHLIIKQPLSPELDALWPLITPISTFLEENPKVPGLMTSGLLA